MVDYEAKKDSRTALSHYDIVRRIEAATGELPYEIKQFKKQVAEFRAMDKKLSALRNKADRKASGKILDKVDAFIKEYKGAYRRCRVALNAINRQIDEVNALYIKLADYYAAAGKRKDEKRVSREASKFENAQRKHLDAIVEALNSASQLSNAQIDEKESDREDYFEKQASSRIEDNRAGNQRQDYSQGARRPQQQAPSFDDRRPPYQQNTGYSPYDPCRMPPMYPPYQPYQPAPSFSIAPISIDVNSAVESAVDSFVKMFESSVGEYLSSYKFPEKTPEQNENRSEEYERAAFALGKTLEDESFALEKLAVLMERVKNLLSGIAELTSTYATIEEKQKSAVESARVANDMQRALAREIQGVQATQKVINGDQLKLAEEQAIIFEQQKATGLQQSELSEAQKALSEEINAVIEAHTGAMNAVKGAVEAQNEIASESRDVIQAGAKLLELQKSLAERQTELTEMQRDALLAHKKLARSQKAVNERVGAKKPKAAVTEQKEAEAEASETAKINEEAIAAEAVIEEASAPITEDAIVAEASGAEVAKAAESEEALPEQSFAEAISEEVDLEKIAAEDAVVN